MPAASPTVGVIERAALTALAARLRAERLELGVSMTSAAEAAGISRVTLHRIEHGEPSVTMGAYLSVASALGLELRAAEAQVRPAAQPELDTSTAATDNESIDIRAYPQLRQLAWHLSDSVSLTPREALSLYERNWRHVEMTAMEPRERALVEHLVETWGGGQLLV